MASNAESSVHRVLGQMIGWIDIEYAIFLISVVLWTASARYCIPVSLIIVMVWSVYLISVVMCTASVNQWWRRLISPAMKLKDTLDTICQCEPGHYGILCDNNPDDRFAKCLSIPLPFSTCSCSCYCSFSFYLSSFVRLFARCDLCILAISSKLMVKNK